MRKIIGVSLYGIQKVLHVTIEQLLSPFEFVCPDETEASRRIEEHGHKRFPQDEWINTAARDTSSRNTRPDVCHVRRPPVYSTNVAVASRKNMMDFKRYRGWLRSSQFVALATTSSIQQQITITQR
ncbi:hypothetical protein FGW20_07595 [Methanoculleus sp. FWC-SCC3]|uniref:Uncharacterized protein n=1 Tax=Methanoculleus methanifontis TaxID=2584086 RepID=A0ABT8M1J0_9EURY|nr:hypothetical protein [Methanoculleus sp. FWC-SCC3]